MHAAREASIVASGKNAASADFVVGYTGAPRVNPMTDKFASSGFHHMEFYCGNASSVVKRFRKGLGMRMVAKSDRTTANMRYSSYVLQSNDLRLIFTSPSHPASSAIFEADASKKVCVPHPQFNIAAAHAFTIAHGLAVRAVGISVSSADDAYRAMIANGGRSVLAPVRLAGASGGFVKIAEVELYGDVVLRVYESSADYSGTFLPGYEAVQDDQPSYGLQRIDHIVGNTPGIKDVYDYITGMTGWHRYAEFNAEDVGTVDSGLNSTVIGNNNEFILMPLNEPTFGTNRRSQIQIYLEANGGAGVQHVALKCPDIVATLTAIKAHAEVGFETLPAPGMVLDVETKQTMSYYAWVKKRAGKHISDELIAKLKALDILVDIDDQGILLQIFTKPLDDRPTIFFEFIQRLCFLPQAEIEEIGGCGGFGKGNFGALFRQIEVDMGDIA